ncbi:MAG: CHAP domain-containing protein, partial [Solirubrobacterales bacterium]
LRSAPHCRSPGAMSVESVLARVATIEQAIANPASLLAANSAATGGTPAPLAAESPSGGGASFAQALQSASAGREGGATATAATLTPTAPYTNPSTPTYPGSATAGLVTPVSYPLATGAGAPASAGAPSARGAPSSPIGEQVVRIAESQIGQTEQPPGSNESPAIAMYRTATAGAIPGAPWCAYFASWAARQAGEPLGAGGEGLGSASQISSWAQSSGRAIPNGPGVTPQPGDLIVFGDEHVGIVKAVLPNGDIQTIEGNYANKVALNVRTPTEATSYVNMN